MSAMPATELTCDSDIELVRALRSVGVLSGLREDDPGDTPGPQQTALASRRDTPDVRHAAFTPRRDTPAARSGRPRDTPVAPLRLTRRGWVVVTVVLVGLPLYALPLGSHKPDGSFTNVLAFPSLGLVPCGTPDHTLTTTMPPGVGAYMITDVVPNKSFSLVKNPKFAALNILSSINKSN